jgi:hypothetical protein
MTGFIVESKRFQGSWSKFKHKMKLSWSKIKGVFGVSWSKFKDDGHS